MSTGNGTRPKTCAYCRRPLTVEAQRSLLSHGTDACGSCAEVQVTQMYLRDRAARAWIAGWAARLRGEIEAAGE